LLVFLEIARVAFLSLARRLWPWLLGLAALSGVDWAVDSELTQVLLSIALAGLLGIAIPAFVGKGLRNGLHGGPLGLSGQGTSYRATVGYGLGAALVAMPFVVGGVAVTMHDVAFAAPVAVGLVLGSAWLGAAAGRLVRTAPAMVMLTWGGAVVSAGFGVVMLTLVPASLLFSSNLVGTHLSEHFNNAHALALFTALAMLAVHGLVLLCAAIDTASPISLRR